MEFGLESDSPDLEITQSNSEDVLIEYVKEKDSLKLEVKEKEKEIQHYKALVYDLSSKVDELQNQTKDLHQEINNLKSKQQQTSTPNKLGVARPTTGRSCTPVMPRAKSSKPKPPKSGQTSMAATPTLAEKSPTTKIDVEKYESALKTLEHLNEVAKKFPELKLSVIFTSEKFFEESDTNHDGTIDEEELETLLTKQGHLFSDKELKEIMTSIDADNNRSIDLMEYLSIMERLQQRKRVNLPQSLAKSSVCAIQ